MTARVDAYRTHSRWSDPGPFAHLLRAIPPEPEQVVRHVSGLLMHPMTAPMRGVYVPQTSIDDRKIRPVHALLRVLLARDGRALTTARPPEARVFCVCAGFARVAVSVLRTHGMPARCRVGFATYFNPGHFEDHWVCEYWDGAAWHLLDAQLDEDAARDPAIDFRPTDVPRDRFVDASTAWRRMRAGEIDEACIGLSPLGFAGGWFVAGNVMLDVAALNKEELLPWEKWSIGRELGPGSRVPPEWAARFDDVAAALAGTPDAERATAVYREHAWLQVTPTVMSFAEGGPVELALDA